LIPARIETDPTRLRQILTNVIGNAIKFTAKGEVDVQIAWGRESNSKGSLKFQVRDTGVGIDAEHEVRLFEPFMQADSSTTRKFGGTGLGLALSRRLARALGGEVWLESNQSQKGATFGISIAAKVVEGSSFFEYSDHFFEQPAPEVQKVDESVLSGVDILVVDDASDNRLLISRFLSAVGANVDCASNGHEGVNRALEKKYDVVLMDIQMPILDGYAATSQLRGQGYRRPIIALTAHALNEERQRSLSAGCDEHLTKPIDKSTLIEQVARIVGKTLH
jgi:CheY-like chemotaxis protein